MLEYFTRKYSSNMVRICLTYFNPEKFWRGGPENLIVSYFQGISVAEYFYNI
jgi:hypothetical protein